MYNTYRMVSFFSLKDAPMENDTMNTATTHFDELPQLR